MNELAGKMGSRRIESKSVHNVYADWACVNNVPVSMVNDAFDTGQYCIPT